jgi:hypothetical protein
MAVALELLLLPVDSWGKGMTISGGMTDGRGRGGCCAFRKWLME